MVLDLGLGWRIGNGEHVDFWHDPWLGNSPLCDEMVGWPIASSLTTVAEFIREEGGWDRELLLATVPSHIADCIFGISFPYANRVDKVIWMLQSTGRYTPRTGYLALMDFNGEKDPGFQRLWKISGPEKWGSFLWLVRHNRLHTQQLRSLRGLLNDAFCSRCEAKEEDTLHLLRDCSHAMAVWLSIIPSSSWNAWIGTGLIDWLDGNMKMIEPRHGLTHSWRVVFVATCWNLWRWRCQAMFEEDFHTPYNPRTAILRKVEEVCQIWKVDKTIFKFVWHKQVAWSPPVEDWVKLNTDGVSKGNPAVAGFGGLIRDPSGNWLVGYVGNIGVTMVMVAELEAI